MKMQITSQHEIDSVVSDQSVRRLVGRIAAGGLVTVNGIHGSSSVLVAMAVNSACKRPILFVVPHLDDADEATDELQQRGIDAVRFPAVEVAGLKSGVNPELISERLAVLRRIETGDVPQIIAAPIQALMQAIPSTQAVARMHRILAVGDHLDTAELALWLDRIGYTRAPAVESPGEFAIRGGIVDIFIPGGLAVRIDLFGDEIEAINEIDLDTMGSDRRLDNVQIVGASIEQLQTDEGARSFASLLPPEICAILVDVGELTEQGRSYYDRVKRSGGIIGPPAVFQAIGQRCHATVQMFQLIAAAVASDAAGETIVLPVQPLPMFDQNVARAIDELIELDAQYATTVYCQNEGEAHRIGDLLTEHGARPDAVRIANRYLHRGFVWAGIEPHADLDGHGAPRGMAWVAFHELVHRYDTRRRIRRLTTSRALDTFVDLEPGDHVVHRDHGLGKFLGLCTMQPKETEAAEEYLTIEFAKNARLHVPVAQIELVQKYIGAFRGEPELSVFGGRKWKQQKEKVREAVRDLAAEMLRIQAAREAMPGIRYPADTPWMKEFEASFPYDETQDQLEAIAAVKRDMSSDRPMDRLICGDVGFGKTEIAIRAAFKAAEYGKQVAVLVPTTVLAEQHERTFRERFASYPFRIEAISRFRTRAEQQATLQATARGQIDVLIGTHRLLSADVKFADLGFVIIDEEQRFGVEHKQRLLELRATVDVLTLSATPIPRTLHMSMLGLRDISSLATAPADRRAIVTEIIGENKHRLRTAIERELAREGQVFFVHNRVYDIEDVAQRVQELAPDARVLVGHGQMPPRALEKVMLQFIRRDADILVCTTIIESGIDIPTANTMIIHDAHMFGLAELHQLRGRVGRYKHRAYCYLVLPQNKSVSEQALKRLHALESFSMLGSGFKIALRDLEIRGAGNLLGAEQSGHISTVGYEMYCQLLDQAVQELRTGRPGPRFETTIDIGIAGMLPKGYIPSDARRLDAYRRLSRATTVADVQQIERDIVSAYGKLPKAAQIFVELAELRVAAAAMEIRSIARHENDIIFRTAQPAPLEQCMAGVRGSLRLVTIGGAGDATTAELFYRPPKNYLEPATLLTLLRRRLATVPDQAKLAAVT